MIRGMQRPSRKNSSTSASGVLVKMNDFALKISCRKEKDERKKLKEGELKAIKHQNEKLEAELRDIKKMLMAMRPTAWVQPLRLNTTESITI